MNNLQVIYGFPEEWQDFQKRHSEFLNRFSNLRTAIDIAFHRVHEKTTLLQRTVYFLGRTALEDFLEILLLCGNGYGIGAQELLRGMYERAVTAEYLQKHPEETDDFLVYEKVSDHKVMMSLFECGAGHLVPKIREEEINSLLKNTYSLQL
ncbi:MAG TPA: DUF5677 domain-containing protein [Terriglobales bacterium]|jgi:hypothetical protein|nr:DUF5677 domain-containing protein [Terriglobales bacterium]